MNTNAQSKIMWTSGLALITGGLVAFDLIPARLEPHLITFLTIAVPLAIFYFRGWRTGDK